MQGGGGRDGTEGWKQDLSCPLLSFVFYPGCAHHLACPPPSKFLLWVCSLVFSEGPSLTSDPTAPCTAWILAVSHLPACCPNPTVASLLLRVKL